MSLMRSSKPSKKKFEKNRKNFKKNIDNACSLWYINKAPQMTGEYLKNFLKNLKISIDKSFDVCYYNQVACDEATLGL